jgi:hypothetical protein
MESKSHRPTNPSSYELEGDLHSVWLMTSNDKFFPIIPEPSETRVGGRVTGTSWGSSSLAAGCMTLRGVTGDGWLQNRNETRPIKRDDGAILSSMGRGMKRLTHAEQGQTWSSFRCLHQTRVGCSAESRLEQKEDYGRDESNMIQGRKTSRPRVVEPKLRPTAAVCDLRSRSNYN